MALVDRPTIFQVVGSLMKHPQYLSETDKYNLTPEDFPERLDKFIFVAIDSLYRNGAERIKPIDVENYLQTNEGAANLFKKENGIGLLQDMEYLSEELNFPYYYKKLKKFNLLDGFKKQGINIEDFYCENPLGCARNLMYVVEGLKITAGTIGITEEAIDKELMYVMQGLVPDELNN